VPHNFQGDSTKSGNSFEDVVEKILKKESEIIHKNLYLESVGCEVDFVINQNNQVIYVECKGGEDTGSKRPGAQRTDNVKKAIANGALIKSEMPDSVYIVYFSAEPVPMSSSDKMLNAAMAHGFIDEIVFVSNKKVVKHPTLW
jgi:hypothetical protein